jgi:hypothetical protein
VTLAAVFFDEDARLARVKLTIRSSLESRRCCILAICTPQYDEITIYNINRPWAFLIQGAVAHKLLHTIHSVHETSVSDEL